MKKISYGKSLEYLNPELAKEWHPTKNGDLTPDNVAGYSKKKVWWFLNYYDEIMKQSFDFEWQATINSRHSGCGCPYIRNRKVWVGFNDLKTRYPDIADEWHPEKNDALTPELVVYGSNKQVWWKCIKGHEWKTGIISRTRGKTGCPFCNGSKVCIGETDFATLFPELLDEFDYENNDFDPKTIHPKSKIRINWKCIKGHRWDTLLSVRTANGSGCPYCSGRLPIKGETDLLTLFPELLTQWNTEKNKKSMDEYTSMSGQKVWWKCKEGHEWRTSISHRTKDKRECPFCTGQKPIVGENDLATLYPYLVNEWSYERNSTVPKDYLPGTKKKVWWKCSVCNHEWKTRIRHRTNGSGCPKCCRNTNF